MHKPSLRNSRKRMRFDSALFEITISITTKKISFEMEIVVTDEEQLSNNNSSFMVI